jgi:hypothetical protein
MLNKQGFNWLLVFFVLIFSINTNNPFGNILKTVTVP